MGTAITYVGHATLLVELSGSRLLTDPFLRGRLGHIRRHAAAPRVERLKQPDAVVVSHAHHDHLDPRSVRLVARDSLLIVPRGCGRMLRRRGLREVIEVDAGDRVAVGNTFVEAVPAVHDGRRYRLGPRRPALGFLLEGTECVYFAGDTDLFPEMGELTGRVDVAALPVGGWGPRVPAGHLDPQRAARAAATIKPRIAIPIHWGTLGVAPARRGIDFAPAREFAAAVARMAPQVEVRVLAPGEQLRF